MRGLSQRALGALVDKDQSKDKGAVRVNRYEQQVNRADMESAAALAEALAVPVAYLFADEDQLAKLILDYWTLTPDRRAVLGKMAAALNLGNVEELPELPQVKAQASPK